MEVKSADVFAHICTAFDADPDIDEFDILPFMKPETAESTGVLLIDHKLGLEAWAVKPLFQYAYKRMMSIKASDHQLPKELIACTRAVLLIQADSMIAWNIHKKLIACSLLDSQLDMKLASIVLTKHPKSCETFFHRKWILSQILSKDSSTLPADTDALSSHWEKYAEKLSLIRAEFAVCGRAADRYPNNYYAWNQRVWMLQHAGGWLPAEAYIDVVLGELSWSADWVAVHVSDYSGFHYRQVVMAQWKQQHAKEQVCAFLSKELSLTSDLILSYPGHEAVWSHRRYVIYSLNKLSISPDISAAVAVSAALVDDTCIHQTMVNKVSVPKSQTEESAKSSNDKTLASGDMISMCSDSAQGVDSSNGGKCDSLSLLQTEMTFCNSLHDIPSTGWQIILAKRHVPGVPKKRLPQSPYKVI